MARTPPVPAAVPPDFLRLLIAGRWVAIATVILTVVLPLRIAVDPPALVVLGVIAALYNISQTWLLRTGLSGRIRWSIVVTIDLLLITLLDWFSGGVRSPFVDLYYLVILVAAAFGELRGSLLTALAVTALGLALAILRPTIPGADWVLRVNYAISVTPYFFLTALGAGYLVRRLRQQWTRREQAEAELEAFQREMEIAQELQAAFAHVQPPRVPGIALGARGTTQYGIGGDMQDYVPIHDGLMIALTDVAGHSLSAALVAARLAHQLEDVGLGVPLEEVLGTWNHSIYERTPPEVYVTAVVCEVRVADGRTRYVAAGHPPPLLWRANTGEVTVVEGTGPALGIFEGAQFDLRELMLQTGDVLLLYTDGAIEARNAEGALLGTDGLTRLLQRYAHLTPQGIVDRLVEEISADYEVRDDMTLVVIEREG